MAEGDNAGGAGDNAGGGDPWFKGVEGITPEEIGHIQTKGWDKDVKAAALGAVRAHREAEKFVGAPAAELLRLPKPEDSAGWSGVWQRLGRPQDKAGYDLTALEVKDADGKVTNQRFVDFVRDRAFELNMPKDAAARLGQALVKERTDLEAAHNAEYTAKLAEEKAALAKNWGGNAEANMFIAKQAAAKLGVSADAVAALESQIGYAAVMNMFHAIGTKIGEDKFVNNPGGGGGVMTREQAVAKKAELMKDSSFAKRMLDGDTQAVREMRALNVLIVGDDTDASKRA